MTFAVNEEIGRVLIYIQEAFNGSLFSLGRFIMQLSSKFRTTNGGSDGYVQAFRSLASCWVRRDEEFLIDECLRFGSDTVSFITHNKQSVRRKCFAVDVFAFKKGAVNGDPLGNGREEELLKIKSE